MENLFTGYTRFRNRKYPILWTGSDAQHIAETFIKNTAEPLHIDVQKSLQGAANFRFSTGMVGVKEHSGFTTEIIWQLKSKKAMIKTAHNRQSTSALLLKNRGIRGTKKTVVFTLDMIDDDTKRWLTENGVSLEEYVKIQNQFLKSKHKA